jgi:hypothetical protein
MSGTHGILQPNQPGYFYITLEESYVTLFKTSAERWFIEHKNEPQAKQKMNTRIAHAVAKAYITDVLVNLSNDLCRTKKSEKDLWVFLSFTELEQRLHGAVKMRVLKDAMKEMIEDGYVFKRQNRDPRFKALEYCLNLSKYRSELMALPAKSIKNDSANLHDDSANLHDDSANLHDDSANLHAIHNIDITNTKLRHNIEEEESANVPSAKNEASFSPPPRQSQEKKSSSQKPQKSAVKLSPGAQVIYETWCKVSWHQGLIPDLTPTLAKHCEAAAAMKTPPTVETMEKVREYAVAKDKYYLDHWSLHFMLKELPYWLARQSSTTKPPAPPVTPEDEEQRKAKAAAVRAKYEQFKKRHQQQQEMEVFNG